MWHPHFGWEDNETTQHGVSKRDARYCLEFINHRVLGNPGKFHIEGRLVRIVKLDNKTEYKRMQLGRVIDADAALRYLMENSL